MNNGNLLNSLLGITSANSAATKVSSAKARAETNEKFQQALEQARPEVAARKPVARKDSAVNEASNPTRPTPKLAARHHSQPEPQRVDVRANAQLDESTAATSASPTPEVDASIPVDADQQDVVVAENQNQTQHQTQSDQAETLVTLENELVTDPTLAIAGQAGELLASPAGLVNPESQPLELAATDIEMLLTTEPALDGSLLMPAASLSPLAALAAGEPGDSVITNPSPLVSTNQIALGQVASQLTNPGQPLVNTAGNLGDLSDTVTLAMEEEGIAVEGELSGDTNSGENPDFLLLNSKAALNKLTEATLTAPALDKAAAATDAAKPAALAAAVESLTRLTEAQSPAARAFVVQTGVPVTVGSPQWSQAVGDKVLWLAAQNVSSAEIRLDPPELGPMQVRVSINQDQANITFTSPHPAVREALDQQLNRLREMFSEQGLNLVNVDVSDKSFAQQDREQQESGKHQAAVELDEEVAPVAITQALSMRLVDHYA